MTRIEHLFLGLLVLSVFFWLIESLFAANPEQPKWRPDIKTDLVYWFITPLVTKSLSQVGIGLILILIYRENIHDIKAMLNDRSTLLARQPLGLQALEIVVLGDFIGY